MVSASSHSLELIREEVELEGYTPDTPEFERVYLARRVQRCQELQNVIECVNCRAFDACPLARQHMINVKYGVGK